MSKRILIAGCGDVGIATAQQLLALGHQVSGLRRNINQLPEGIHGIRWDLAEDNSEPLPACDYLIYCVAPGSRDPERYKAVLVDGAKQLLAALPQPPELCLFVSSSGVYQQAQQQWLDETSPAEPSGGTAEQLLIAEQQIQQLCPTTVVRFSGIYGPGRNHLLNQVKQGRSAPLSPIQLTNRIHRDDCAGVLVHLLQKHLSGEPLESLYLATDDQPVALQQVTDWLAEQLDVTVTQRDLARGTGSKRLSNQRLKDSGYQFLYPSFIEGYRAILADLKD